MTVMSLRTAGVKHCRRVADLLPVSRSSTERAVWKGPTMTRRLGILTVAGVFAALLVSTPQAAQTSIPKESTNAASIRPFRISVPEAELTDLRRRIAATRWPDKEVVTDQSQGVQLATMQKLARYWATDYDWRKVRGEAERPAAVHHRDRRASTFTSFTCVRSSRTRCR